MLLRNVIVYQGIQTFCIQKCLKKDGFKKHMKFVLVLCIHISTVQVHCSIEIIKITRIFKGKKIQEKPKEGSTCIVIIQ